MNHTDKYAPARGCLYALSFSLAIWAFAIVLTLILIKFIGG